MRIAGQHGGRRKKKGSAGVFMILAALIALTVWIDLSMRPAIESVIAYQAKVFAARLINEAIIEQMARSDIEYGELARITRGKNGEITSIEADMVGINRFKTMMSASIIQKLDDAENREITLPVGTVIGNQFTAGRGPLLGIKIIPTGYVQSEIYNHFTAAGINQTQHQIMLRINVQMLAVMPGYSVKTDTETGFCIAETVIIGEIPQGYASFGGGVTAFAPVG